MTKFDGKVDIQGSRKVIAALKGHPELEYSLHKLFEVLNEVLDEDIEDEELNDDSEVSSLIFPEYRYKTAKVVCPL